MKLPILTYHSLDTTGSPVSVDPESFRRQLIRLREAGYRAVPLRDGLAELATINPDSKLVALTFDDGYASVLSIAYPILAEYGWRGTVFPVTGYVGQKNRWPTQPASIPETRLMDWGDLQAMADANWEIGAHTRTHPDLTTVDELAGEIYGARSTVEDRLGKEVSSFAYPYGRFNDRVRECVRAGFAASCTTTMAIAETSADRATLPRLEMWYFSRGGTHRLLASRLLEPYVTLCRSIRRGRRLLHQVRHGLIGEKA